jgi:hypothetical protein
MVLVTRSKSDVTSIDTPPAVVGRHSTSLRATPAALRAGVDALGVS